MRPGDWRGFVAQAKFSIRIAQALAAGPPFVSRLDRIIIDLTSACDLRCPDCNRSCGAGQAPGSEFLEVDQVRRFIEESVSAGKRWRRIMLEGGEPTLHPRLDEILAALSRYRAERSPGTRIELCTNGHGELSRRALRTLPPGIQVKNSRKSLGQAQSHFAFNAAPADLADLAGADFTEGCYIHRIFGLGLTRSGYYPHPVCGGIDRVLGFDIGLKRLPASTADMAGQMRRLCPMCGHYHQFRGRGRWARLLRRGARGRFPPGYRSESWLRAYADYRERPPRLSAY